MNCSLIRIFLFLFFIVPSLLFGQQSGCYSGKNTQLKAFSNYLSSIIQPVLTTSNASPLKLTDQRLNISFNWDKAVVNFNAPSYFATASSSRLLEIYYTNGVGPTVTLHKYPIAKVYDWYGQPQSLYRFDEFFLSFTYSINGAANVESRTLVPSVGNSYSVKQNYQLFRDHYSRSSTDGWCGNYMPGANANATRVMGPKAQFFEFQINSVEADFKNLLDGSLLKFCKEDKQIDLYDYFTDKNNVRFDILLNNVVIKTANILQINDLQAGQYKIRASKQYANGAFEKTINLHVVNTPVVSITTNLGENINTFCEGELVTLSAPIAPTGENYTYRWSTGETSRTIQTNRSWSGTVSVSNGSCNTISPSISITMNSAPKPTIINQSFNNNICESTTVTLLTNAVAESYVWLNENNEVVGKNQVLTTDKAGTYKVQVTYANGCQNISDPLTITVSPNPAPLITASGSLEFCEGESIRLTASLPNNQVAQNYTWSNGKNGQSVEITESGIYTVTVTNPNGCTRISEPIHIKVKPNPKPLLVASGVLKFCFGESVTLTVSNAYLATKVLWSNGDEGTSTKITTSGNYYATVFREDCSSTSEQLNVQVYENVKPIIASLSNTEICEGETATLQVTNPQPNTQYEWSNGQRGLQATTTITGNIYVIASNNTCTSHSESLFIKVNPIAQPTISIDNEETICQGDSIRLTINEVGNAYRWSTGETTKSITVRNTGTYTAFIITGNCERASNPMQITVKPNNKIVISKMGENEFCEGDSLLLTVINQGKYLWNTGETTRSINIKKSGKYSVTVTNDFNCESRSEIYDVIVRPIPKPTIYVTGNTTFCETDSTILTINETAKSYRWSTGETTKSITVKRGGNYVAYISNEFGCERTSEPVRITVHPNPKPQINITGKTTFCETDSVLLYVTPIAGMKYTWSNGVVGSSIVVKTSGNYFVSSTTVNNCTSISESVNVVVHPLPKPTIYATGSTTFCETDSIMLTINETAKSYRWSTGETTKSITVKRGGNYVAYISNQYGCERNSDPVTITVHSNPKPTITYRSLVACDGDSLLLTASNGVSYLWSNGAITKDIWVKNPAEYYVKITNTYGCERISEPVRVSILPNDVPTILSSNGIEFCEGETTTLTASLASLYRWSTGETTRSITVNKTGKYTVTVINANDCERTSLPLSIVVNRPTPLNVITNREICINENNLYLDDLNKNPLGGIYSGSGVILNYFNPESAGAGTHSILYTYTNAKGCVSETSFQIEVIPLVQLTVGDDLTLCLNDNKVLLINDQLPIGTLITGVGVQGSEFNPNTAGIGRHLITYTYLNKSTCTTTATRVITVNPIPSAPVVTGNNKTCNNSTLTLSAKSTVLGNYPILYRWYRENDLKPFAEGETIRFVVKGSERIYVEAYTSQCPSNRTEINIYSLTPTIRISPNATEIIQGRDITFTLEDIPLGNPSVKWEWDFGDGFYSYERSPKHYYNKEGIYTVKVRAYSVEGCIAEINEIDYINVIKDPLTEIKPTEPESPIMDKTPYENTVVYPNPVKNATAKLRVNNPKTSQIKGMLQVYTMSGRLLLTQELSLHSGQNDIDINNLHQLRATQYFLFVVQIEGEKTFKTLKVLVL